MKLDFLRCILEKYPNVKFNEICPVWATLFHADGRMDAQADRHDEVNSFRSFANTLKIVCVKDTQTRNFLIPT
jgi:hypothetical protein